ncbi:MAG: hypothetical protein ABIG89_00205 [Candidatus Woesearchaeota archaeon]
MEQKEELENTFIELYESANILINQSKFKSSTILLSKALFALIDLILYINYKNIPNNHSHRFRILESKCPELYLIVNEMWNKYTDTYSKPVAEDSIAMIKKSIKEIVKKNETISEKIKKTIRI